MGLRENCLVCRMRKRTELYSIVATNHPHSARLHAPGCASPTLDRHSAQATSAVPWGQPSREVAIPSSAAASVLHPVYQTPTSCPVHAADQHPLQPCPATAPELSAGHL